MHQLLKYRGVNPILIHTSTTTSTWLCLKIFHLWIRNSVSPISKHSELLASHRSDLRSKRYLCLYSSRAAFDSRALCRWVTYPWQYTPTSHLYAILVSLHSLIIRTANQYGTPKFTLNKHHCPLIMYHLIMNIFKSYSINSPLSIVI